MTTSELLAALLAAVATARITGELETYDNAKREASEYARRLADALDLGDSVPSLTTTERRGLRWHRVPIDYRGSRAVGATGGVVPPA